MNSETLRKLFDDVRRLRLSPDAAVERLGATAELAEEAGDPRLAVEALLGGDVPLLATVAAHGVGFPKKVRNDPRIALVKMGRESRDAVVGEILRRLGEAGIGDASIVVAYDDVGGWCASRLWVSRTTRWVNQASR